MQTQNTTPCVVWPDLFGRPLSATFDLPHASSDGGAILLRAVDARLHLTSELARSLRDDRIPGKVEHSLQDLLGQRIFGLACGYADGNDAARLAQDPVHKILLGRDPIAGDRLASQPTLSRFENAPRARDLVRMGETLAAVVIDRHRQRVGRSCRRVVVDLDTMADPTHGAQQLSLFHGHYDTWCYLHLLGFLSFDDEAEQYLFTALLRPGNAPDRRGLLAVLRRLLPQLRSAFPRARILVRLDGGFVHPELLDLLDRESRVDYVLGLPKNAVLKRRSRRLLGTARRKSRRSQKTEHVYGECRYQARRWSRPRRVIIKAEVVRLADRQPKDNPRFLVTNLPQAPRWIYERTYCARGEVENRIKELQYGLEIDRTSCSQFFANQFRVLLTVAAFVFFQELRLQAAHTSCARAQVWTLRDRLLKLGALVSASVRRLVVRLPKATPAAEAWISIAQALGATGG